MIEESYVCFDTAKMLKEAWFDEPCSFCYSPCKDIRRKNYKRNSDLVKGFFPAPRRLWRRGGYARCIIMRYVFGIVQNMRNGFTLMGIWII